MTQRQRDLRSAIVWFVASIAICLGSVNLSLGRLNSPGPGFFSFLAGALLGICSMVCFFQSIKRDPSEISQPFWINPKRKFKVAYVFMALISYTIFMDYLGFLISTLLFLGFLFRAIDPISWPRVLIGSFLGAFTSYGLFNWWLDVQLPIGIFGF